MEGPRVRRLVRPAPADMKGPRARRYGEAPHPPICKGPAPADMEGLRFRRYVRASHPPILNTAPDTELPCISRRSLALSLFNIFKGSNSFK